MADNPASSGVPARDPEGPSNADVEARGEPQRQRAPVRRRGALIIIGVIALLVVAAVLVYWLMHRGQEGTDDAQVDADVVALAPRVAGTLAAVPVREGQAVTTGQLLMQLDDRSYRARVAQARAQLASATQAAAEADAKLAVAEATSRGSLASARAGLTGSTRSVSTAAAQLREARAMLTSRRADLRLARTSLWRTETLRRGSAIAPQQVDQARAQFASAQAGVAAAQATLAAAGEQLRRAQAQVAQSQGAVTAAQPVAASIEAARANAADLHARVDGAKAALDAARLDLEWTRVVAPGPGVVSDITAHPGSYVAVGQTVAQYVPDTKYVTANFKETQVGAMRVGDRADVKVDTYGKTIAGRVESIAGGTGARFSLLPPDNATGNFVKVAQRIPVRVVLDEVPAGMQLRAGQSVDVTVYVGK